MKVFKFGLCTLLSLALVSGCTTTETSVETSTSYDKEVDVLIIGAGGAGLSAAVEASDTGAESVLVIEKLSFIGGTTFVSQGMIAGYDTVVQEAAGVETITYEEMYDNLMSNASYRLDTALTSITVAESGNTIDWLVERVGVTFMDTVYVGYGPLQMMHVVDGGGIGLSEPYQSVLETAGVEILLSTTGESLITDDLGNVVGAMATDSEGNVMTIKANAVVIATGGYSNNPELTELLDPQFAGTFGIGFPGATGDGLIMASNIGAAVTHSSHLMAVLKDYEIMSEYNGTSSSATVSSFMGLDNVIMVGAEAQRFVDEKSGGYMSQELNFPVFEQMNKDNLGYVWAISDVATVEAAGVVRGNDMEFITADTVEELASLMGLDAETLQETIDTYNGYVDVGYDEEFKRTDLAKLEAPYVAVAVVPCEIITYGGLARNDQSEVLRADGTTIGGLYAAGEVTANSAYMGFTISNAITWGRIAGEQAANYIPE